MFEERADIRMQSLKPPTPSAYRRNHPPFANLAIARPQEMGLSFNKKGRHPCGLTASLDTTASAALFDSAFDCVESNNVRRWRCLGWCRGQRLACRTLALAVDDKS